MNEHNTRGHRPDNRSVRSLRQVNSTIATPVSKRVEQQYAIDMSLPGQPEKPGSRAYKPVKKKKRPVLKATVVMMALLMLTGGGLFAKGYVKLHKSFNGKAETVAALKVEAEKVDPDALKGEGSGRINILVMGKGGDNHPGGELTDTMLIASIDPVNKQAAMLSVPRDLWVNIPEYKAMKINAAYALAKQKALRTAPKDTAAAEAAGISNVEGIVSQVTGLPIHYYAMVDFTAFKQAIDTVGGVNINVPEDLYDPTMAWENNWSPVLASKGAQSMDGKKALLYVRSRHTSSDFARSQRQRAVIEALEQKIMTAGVLANPVKLSELVSAFGDHFETDLSIANAERLGNIARNIDMAKVESIGLADPPNNYVMTDRAGSQSVVRPVAGFDNYAAIQNFVRNKFRDGYLTKENATVVVVSDRAHADAASAKVDELRSFGYNVPSSASVVTSIQADTKVIDLSQGSAKFTRHYLEDRFDVKADTSLPTDVTVSAKGAKFVIIVGDASSSN